jgi:hypothetical protein
MSMIESRTCRQSHRAQRRRTRLVSVASISLALAAAISLEEAHAATVRAVQGQVLVNAGQGYRLVDGSTELDPGGTVVANPGAVAEVVYPGGCVVTVQPGSVYLVASAPPCRSGEPRGEPVRRASLPDREESKGGDGSNNSGGGGGVNNGTAWAIGGVAVLAGGAAAYFIIPALSP